MIPVSDLFEKQEFEPGKKTDTGDYTHYEPKDKPKKSEAAKDPETGGPLVRSKKFRSKSGNMVVLRFQKNADSGKMELLSKLKK